VIERVPLKQQRAHALTCCTTVPITCASATPPRLERSIVRIFVAHDPVRAIGLGDQVVEPGLQSAHAAEGARHVSERTYLDHTLDVPHGGSRRPGVVVSGRLDLEVEAQAVGKMAVPDNPAGVVDDEAIQARGEDHISGEGSEPLAT